MGYQWSKGWRLNADLTVNSRNGTSVQSYTNGFALLNTSLQKEIKQKLTLSATLQNPFAKYRYSTETYFAPDFEQLTTNQLFYRSFGLSINYRFGKLKEGVKRSKRGIKNDDVD
jgi:ferric enterobactin receptor